MEEKETQAANGIISLVGKMEDGIYELSEQQDLFFDLLETTYLGLDTVTKSKDFVTRVENTFCALREYAGMQAKRNEEYCAEVNKICNKIREKLTEKNCLGYFLRKELYKELDRLHTKIVSLADSIDTTETVSSGTKEIWAKYASDIHDELAEILNKHFKS